MSGAYFGKPVSCQTGSESPNFLSKVDPSKYNVPEFISCVQIDI